MYLHSWICGLVATGGLPASAAVSVNTGRSRLATRNSENALTSGLLQFHIPVRLVEELSPGSVSVIGEFNVQHRIALWFDRVMNKMHVGLFGGSPAFTHVAFDTGADHVFPSCGAILRTGDYMVQA